MRLICDLEIHSKYSRAVSKDSDPEHLELWAAKKGSDIVGTGDFTHPEWREELAEKLEEIDQSGLYQLKKKYSILGKGHPQREIRFLWSGEVSCIYPKGGQVRRVHLLIFAPHLAAAEKISHELTAKGGKLRSDGRPILGMDAKQVLEIVLENKGSLIPAHVWTPWFGLFGSKSGFDSIEECFDDLSPFVYAIETGLSSDPPMNWRIPFLDTKHIVSFSDAHSPQNIGREATVVEVPEASYQNIFKAFQDPDEENRIDFTIEFFPEEGKYHYDGHRACGFSCSPPETKRLQGICPKCRLPLTVGVMHRVEELALHERGENFVAPERPAYKKIVPLAELVAAVFGVGKASKRVGVYYNEITAQAPEFELLLFKGNGELSFLEPRVLDAILHMRREHIEVKPGYDGVYGTITVPPGGRGQRRLL